MTVLRPGLLSWDFPVCWNCYLNNVRFYASTTQAPNTSDRPRALARQRVETLTRTPRSKLDRRNLATYHRFTKKPQSIGPPRISEVFIDKVHYSTSVCNECSHACPIAHRFFRRNFSNGLKGNETSPDHNTRMMSRISTQSHRNRNLYLT